MSDGPGGSPGAFTAGLKGRCPNCGKGPLFRGFLAVRTRCEVCEADLSAQDSGDGPAAFIILIVGAVVVGAAGITEVMVQPPVWVHLLLWLPLTVIGVLALMRPFKGGMIGLQWKHRRADFDPD